MEVISARTLRNPASVSGISAIIIDVIIEKKIKKGKTSSISKVTIVENLLNHKGNQWKYQLNELGIELPPPPPAGMISSPRTRDRRLGPCA